MTLDFCKFKRTAEDRCRMSDAVVDVLSNSGVVWNVVWHRFGVFLNVP